MTAAPPEVRANRVVPVLLDVRLTAVPPAGARTGWPAAFWRVTVTGPRVALAEAGPDSGVLVKARVVAALSGVALAEVPVELVQVGETADPR